MPFRRKHRNSFFGSSRSADKENANEGMQEPMLLQPPVSPRLFRCHSDNSQRTCCDINPNTVSSVKNVMHRNSVLSTKEKMANLLELNSTLVKEVSFLRNSQVAMSSNMNALKEELQATSVAAHALQSEKQELAEEVNKMKTAHLEMQETLEAEKSDAQGRLECVSLVVDNLQSMNGVLAEEAARLREDADLYATERHALLADLDKVMEEKSFLEGFVDSIRTSEEEYRREMQQALLQAEREKKTLFEEKQALLEENGELQIGSEELKKVVEKLNIAFKYEKEVLLEEKKNLRGELTTSTYKLQEVSDALASETQALVSAQDTFNEEKTQMLAEKGELECSLLHLQKGHQEANEQFKAERHAFECEVRELRLQNEMLSEEKDKIKQDIKIYQEEIQNLQQELMLSKEAAMIAKAQAKASLETAEKQKSDAIAQLEREVQDAAKKASIREGELVSNAKALECELDAAHKALSEEKFHARAKSDEVTRYKEKLDKATHEISTLEGKLVVEKDKQKRLDVHIQTLKGDLLVAEDAAIQAQNKAKATEKEARVADEKRTREASQKIGALESKLTAMAERQSDLENHIRFKENAFKVAVLAENEAKGKLNGLLDVMQSRGKNIEGYFEALKASMLEMQINAMKGNESIACLQEEFASMMELQVNINNNKNKKRRGRSRAKAYQAQQLAT